MDARKIISLILLCFIMVAYQNCGSGLLPDQSIDGFQSNGGGYSGIHHSQPTSDISLPEDEPMIDINKGECTGKIMSYHLVSDSCPATDYSAQDWSSLLSSETFTLNGEEVSLPVGGEALCKEFISKYILVVDSCADTIKQVERSAVEYIGNGSTVTIDGLIYKSFGIQVIY